MTEQNLRIQIVPPGRNASFWMQHQQHYEYIIGQLFTVSCALFTNKLFFFPGKLLVFFTLLQFSISHLTESVTLQNRCLTLSPTTANRFIILVRLTRKTLCTGTWEVAHNIHYIRDRLSNVTEIKTQMSKTHAYVYMVIHMCVLLVPCDTQLVRWKEA